MRDSAEELRAGPEDAVVGEEPTATIVGTFRTCQSPKTARNVHETPVELKSLLTRQQHDHCPSTCFSLGPDNNCEATLVSWKCRRWIKLRCKKVCKMTSSEESMTRQEKGECHSVVRTEHFRRGEKLRRATKTRSHDEPS